MVETEKIEKGTAYFQYLFFTLLLGRTNTKSNKKK